jgi:hypothetical protein
MSITQIWTFFHNDARFDQVVIAGNAIFSNAECRGGTQFSGLEAKDIQVHGRLWLENPENADWIYVYKAWDVLSPA